ncbi:MAG: TRAP transporter small permease [Granulosicoccus sp.]|nr:TRAP transporter small permease [Granulosicoccus sp.]
MMPERSRSPARPLWMRAVAGLSGLCGALSASMILAAVLLTCQMIWVRKINNASTVWQTESVIYLMIGATLIGLPYVQLLRGHVNVDLLPRLLPAFMRKALACLTLMVAMGVIGVMLFYSAELWHVAWVRGWTSDTVWGPPLWIPYLTMPLGFGIFLLQLGADLVATITDVDDPFPEAGH